MRAITALAAVVVVACASAAKEAVPPCDAPRGIVPAVDESMCSAVVVPENAAGVVVRSYGKPATEVLVTDMTPSNFAYGDVLNSSVSNILLYLESAIVQGPTSSRIAPCRSRCARPAPTAGSCQ